MITVSRKSLISVLAGMVSDPSLLEDRALSSISQDSRTVQHGGLYLSLATDQEQRLQYLKQAITSGAAAILYDQRQDLTSEEITVLAKANIAAYAVQELADKAGEIAARFHGHPSVALTIIAVTGTNGKTSVSQFIAQSLELLDKPCGVIGTLGAGRIGALNETGMTTPDPVTVQTILAGFCHQGLRYAVIEASSHALEQGRLNSVEIDVAVLTNISRDHLDYHNTMEAYFAAKARLFNFTSVKTAIINADDHFGQALIDTLSTDSSKTVWTYSHQQEESNFYIKGSKATPSGLEFELISEFGCQPIKSPLLGQFNSDNLVATLASLVAIEIPFEKACIAIEKCTSIKGRMQAYGRDTQVQVVVDFAHTPDALTKVLLSLRKHLSDKGRLWCVLGCGGDRDVGKRAEMGRSAEYNADKIVLTDDNPRSEPPTAIIRDILEGISHPEKVIIEHDRHTAIAYALSHANTDDIVLIAGKGHETYQEIAGIKQPFSDIECVKELLAIRNNKDCTISLGGQV